VPTQVKTAITVALSAQLARCNARWEFGAKAGYTEKAMQALTQVLLIDACGRWYHVHPEYELAKGKRRADFVLLPRRRYRRTLPLIVIELKYLKPRCVVLDRHTGAGRWRTWCDARHGSWFHSPQFAAAVLKDLATWGDIGAVPILLNRVKTTVAAHCRRTERGQLREYMRLAAQEHVGACAGTAGFVLCALGNRVYSGGSVIDWL